MVPTMILPRRTVSAFLVLWTAFSLAGCGTGHYNAQLEQSAVQLGQQAELERQQAEFAKKFYAAAKIGGSAFAIQVPQQFPAGVEIETASLPGLNLPGAAIAYSASVPDASGGQYPYFLILGAVDASQATAAKLLSTNPAATQLESSGELVKMIRNALPNGNVGAPEQVTGQVPGGQPVAWTKVRATGEMPFAVGGNAMTLPGALELYVHAENGWVGWFAWRVPTAIEQHSKLAELAPGMAGTAQFQ